MDIPKTMKSLIKRKGVEGYEYIEIPVPEPGIGDLLVKVLKVGICGSDIALFKWDQGRFIIKHHIIPVDDLFVYV